MLKLSPRKLVRSEFSSAHYTVIVPAGTPFSAVLSPDYWAHVASGLKGPDATVNRAGDVIAVVAEDGSFDEELRVVGLLKTPDKTRAIGAKVRIKRLPPPGIDVAIPETDPSGYTVKYRGPQVRWSVLAPDKSIVSERHETKEEAEAALADHLMDRAA